MPSVSTPRIVRLAVLEGYKVRWDRATVARDIVQNFFDEVRDFRQVAIVADPAKKFVRVSGPSTFAMDYLRYIGATTKRGRRTAGGFGEGFKIAALVLLRDYRTRVVAGSSGWEIAPKLVPMKFGAELCYEVRRRVGRDRVAGSYVEIHDADAALCAAFAASRDFFFHGRNPRIANVLHANARKGIGVFYAVSPKRGDLFYRKQHRGELKFPKGAALSVVCHDSVDGVEADRDRRAVRRPSRIVSHVLARVPDDVLWKVIQHLRAYWTEGNSVLGAALAEAAARGLRFQFSTRWLAKGGGHGAYSVEALATRRGFLLAVRAFGAVGMETVEKRFAPSAVPRPPTPMEAARIEIAHDVYARLTGERLVRQPTRVFEMQSVGVGTRPGFVAASSLAATFEDGIAGVLCAIARFPRAQAHSNADRLTKLLEGLLREAGRLRAFALRWDRAAGLGGKPAEALPLDIEDDKSLRHFPAERNVVVSILAPPGFPPVGKIMTRIRGLALRLGVRVMDFDFDVTNEEQAFKENAHGIPSVWIGRREIDPSGEPRYALRTFETPTGPSLLPCDEVILAAIEKEAKRRTDTHVFGVRRARAQRPYEAWLRANAPARFRDLGAREAIDEAVEEIASTLDIDDDSLTGLAAAVARDALRRVDWTRDTLAATAAHHTREALDWATKTRTQYTKETWSVAAARIAHAVLKGVDRDSAVSDVLARAPHLADVERLVKALPLDEQCQGFCEEAATTLLFEHALEPRARLIEALEARVREASEIAIETHRSAQPDDEDGGDSVCDAAMCAIATRFGIPNAVADEQRAIAEVKRAWDEAIARGASELDAAARCLEIGRREPA